MAAGHEASLRFLASDGRLGSAPSVGTSNRESSRVLHAPHMSILRQNLQHEDSKIKDSKMPQIQGLESL